jgi:carboxymethylenebutenolidase
VPLRGPVPPQVVLKRASSSVGIVMVHDITGLDAFNQGMADRLNREGFWVAAVDLFDGQTAKGLEDGMKLRTALTRERMIDGLRAGLDRLRGEMGAHATIGALGFCMGGGAALQGACALPFAFCVDYYGRIEDADEVKGLQGPLLLILGSEDDRLNPWVYGQLLPKLDEHKKRVRMELYPGVGHAFHREGWPPYDATSARDAWGRAMAFIRAPDLG